MEVKGVVFDFGGVMTACAAPLRVKELTDAKALPWQAVMDGFAKYRRAYDLGDISVADFYDRVWRDAGVTVSAEDRAAIEEADTASFLHPNEQTLDWMRALKARGLKLGILTNMPRELAPRFRDRFSEVIALCDALVISSDVHLVKPMRAIYDLMAQKLGLTGPELCFFDDAEINCRGAREAGWRAIRFESIGSAVAAFGRQSPADGGE